MKTKRLWAILLSLVMTVSMIPSTALAVETTDETDKVSEAVTGEAVEEDTADDAEETTVTEEAEDKTSDDAPEAVSDENEETEEEADVPGESEEDKTPEEPENVEDKADEDLQEGSAAEDETEPEMPAQTFEGKVGDIEVSVVAEAGAFLPDTEMELTEVKAEDIAEAVADAAGESATIVAAVDITFKNKGIEVEPEKHISVSMKTGEKLDTENTALVHVDNEGVAEVVEEEQIEEITDEGVAFISDAFSVYAVIEPNSDENARLTVRFWKDDEDTEPIEELYVKKADLTSVDVNGKSMFEMALYDPGIGDPGHGVYFNGWSISSEKNSDDGKKPFNKDNDGNYPGVTIDEVRAKARDILNGTVNEGDVLNVYAVLLKVYIVSYLDPDGVAMGTDQVLVPTGQTWMDYTISRSYTVEDELHAFLGWQTDDQTHIQNVVTPNDMTSANSTRYQLGTTMEINGDVQFRASAPEGYWLIFNEVIRDATYISPWFCINGVVPSDKPVPDKDIMKANGYVFDKWYTGTATTDDDGFVTDVNYGSEFIFTSDDPEQPVTIGSTTNIYANWTKENEARYQVIVWKESLKDTYAANRGNNAQEKQYDFFESFTFYGDTNGTFTPFSDAVAVGNPQNNDTYIPDSQTDAVGTYKNVRISGKTTKGLTQPDKIVTITGRNPQYNDNVEQKKYNIPGYHKGSVDPAKEIAPDGSTIFNVYYDRNVVTYTFKELSYTWKKSDNRGGWGIDPVTGKYVRLYYRLNLLPWRLPCSNYDNTLLDNDVYIRRKDENGRVYDEKYWSHIPVFNPPYRQRWYKDYSGGIRVLRDQDNNEVGNLIGLFDEEMTWPDSSYEWWTSAGPNFNTQTGTGTYSPQGTRLTFKSSFLPDDNNMEIVLYGKDVEASSNDFDVNLVYYLQDKDDPSKYNLEYIYEMIDNQNNRLPFDVVDKYAGYVAYAVYSTDSADVTIPDVTTITPFTNPSSADNTTFTLCGDKQTTGNNIGAYDQDKTKTGYQNINTKQYIIMFWNRDQDKITFMDGSYLNSRGVSTGKESTGNIYFETEGYPFETDISSYNKNGNKYYDPEKPNTGLGYPEVTNPGYVFAGWYKDKACTDEYEFTTMPQGGIVVFAKWIQKQYRVFLYSNLRDADGPIDTSISWGNSNQKLNFLVDFNGHISIPTGTRNRYKLIGWYTDQNCKVPFIPSLRLNDTSVTTEYNKTERTELPEELEKYGVYMGEPAGEGTDKDNKDARNNRFWITSKFELWARWNVLMDGADGISIIYDVNKDVAGENTGLVEDPLFYQNGAEVKVQYAPVPKNEEGEVRDDIKFSHWTLQKWAEGTDGQEGHWVDDGDVLPGGTFTALFDNSQKTPLVDDETGEQIPGKYEYIIKLKAEYVDVTPPTNTFIHWYRNQNANDNEKKEFNNLRINETVDIKTPDGFGMENPGYKFIGWAKQRTISSEDDLFLKYTYGSDGSTGTFEAKNRSNELKTVTKVAADEVRPYDNLYAIWQPVYYIYHTGTAGGNIETVEIETKNTPNKIKPYLYCDDNLLYGGYFIDNLKENDDNIIPSEGTTKRFGNEIKGGPAYSGDNMKKWTFKTAGTDDEIEPQAGDVIYIKEVPLTYLIVKFHIVYNQIHEGGKVKALWYLVDADDKNYDNLGVKVTETNSMGITDEGCTNYQSPSPSFYDKLDVKKSGTVVSTRSVTSIYPSIKTGVFGGIPADRNFYETVNQKRELVGFWKTKDGVIVYSNRIKVISTGTGENGIVIYNPEKDNNTIIHSESDDYNGDRIEFNTDIVTPVISTGSGNNQDQDGSHLVIKTDVSVTKKADDKVCTQYVEPGDCSGEIEPVNVEGKVFAGWYMDSSFKKAADFSNVTDDMEVYGKYINESAFNMTLSAGYVVGGKVSLIQKTIVPKGRYVEAGVIYKVGDTEEKVTGTAKSITTTTFTTKWSMTKMKSGTSFTVTPYCVTNDGTMVYGSTMNCTVKSLKIIIE